MMSLTEEQARLILLQGQKRHKQGLCATQDCDEVVSNGEFCINCTVDIMMEGEWTGKGYPAWLRYKEAVGVVSEKAKADKEGDPASERQRGKRKRDQRG